MFPFRFSMRNMVTGLVLTGFLTIGFYWIVTAQDPDNGEPLWQEPGSSQVYEEELEGSPGSLAPQVAVTGAGEPGLAPDKFTPYHEEEVEQGDSVSNPSSAQFFKRYSANVFVPYDDDMLFNYSGAGCVYRTGGTSFSDHDIQLPDGAEIDFLRVYFYDNDPVNDAEAHLFAFDGNGGFTSIASASSSGTPGQSSSGSDFFSYFVDNINQAFTIRLDYNGGSNANLRLCGVRIRYQYSLASLNLPVILNDLNP